MLSFSVVEKKEKWSLGFFPSISATLLMGQVTSEATTTLLERRCLVMKTKINNNRTNEHWDREGAGGGAAVAIAPPIFWKDFAVTMTSQK